MESSSGHLEAPGATLNYAGAANYVAEFASKSFGPRQTARRTHSAAPWNLGLLGSDAGRASPGPFLSILSCRLGNDNTATRIISAKRLLQVCEMILSIPKTKKQTTLQSTVSSHRCEHVSTLALIRNPSLGAGSWNLNWSRAACGCTVLFAPAWHRCRWAAYSLFAAAMMHGS